MGSILYSAAEKSGPVQRFVTKVIIGWRRAVVDSAGAFARVPSARTPMKYHPALRPLTPALLGTAALLLASCASTPLPREEPPAAVVAPQPAPIAAAPATQPAPMILKTSNATNARAYRADAAQHVYAKNGERIWKGRLPPMLYAIGVLQVEVDGRGEVRNLNWMRAPRHAPEVIAEIERTVRAAAPYPMPARMGKVVWTDTWLWHQSGQFQLDTLTEGQD
jgi:hypothetical protein